MSIPGARVNREQFLKAEFGKYCKNDIIDAILEKGTGKAGIGKKLMDQVADSTIGFHTTTCTATSAVAGIPGGLAMIGTITADLSQFYLHVLVVAQKLAYIYGWPSFDDEDPTDEYLLLLTIFIGVMAGAKGASSAIANIAKQLATEVVKKLPRQALTKLGIFQIAKQIAKWLGISLTKSGFARGAAKLIPLLGAIISGSITLATFLPIANKLKDHLRILPLAEKD